MSLEQNNSYADITVFPNEGIQNKKFIDSPVCLGWINTPWCWLNGHTVYSDIDHINLGPKLGFGY